MVISLPVPGGPVERGNFVYQDFSFKELGTYAHYLTEKPTFMGVDFKFDDPEEIKLLIESFQRVEGKLPFGGDLPERIVATPIIVSDGPDSGLFALALKVKPGNTKLTPGEVSLELSTYILCEPEQVTAFLTKNFLEKDSPTK